MNNKIVIGLTGSIGSGCTTIGKNFFENEMGFKYESLSTSIKHD